MIYFFSDLHIGDKGIINYERTEFKTVEEHNDFIAATLQKLHETDLLYILGDLGWDLEKIKEIFKTLKCKVILILGNHDKRNINFYRTLPNVIEVYQTPIWFNKRVLLSHEPYPVPDGCFNIHGHLHDAKLTLSNYINVSAKVIDYKPLKGSKVERLLTRCRKPNWDFMEEWFAPYFMTLSPHSDLIYNEDGSINIEKSLEFLKRNASK